MSPGDVVLIDLPQVGGGATKLRPALLLAELPGPYQNLLLCGISTQLHQLEPQWDELVESKDADFTFSGLHHDSIIRRSYLHAVDPSEIAGVIGSIDAARLQRLRQRLSDHLRP
ncbi:MAG: type II toxin-antitoxin system PemK/MazF family toxin [Planctomycetes bacterium]|nr:type II toxin-antitoxin system PemK/MazF family toxin [Planctomycetota bacterium]